MLGWCMWQVMHCAVGIARVKTWRIGWPRLADRGVVGVGRRVVPAWPSCVGPGAGAAMVGSTVAVWPSRP